MSNTTNAKTRQAIQTITSACPMGCEGFADLDSKCSQCAAETLAKTRQAIPVVSDTSDGWILLAE